MADGSVFCFLILEILPYLSFQLYMNPPYSAVQAHSRCIQNIYWCIISWRLLQKLCVAIGCGLISIENLLWYVKQRCGFFFFYPLLILRIKRSLRSLFSTYSTIILCFAPFILLFFCYHSLWQWLEQWWKGHCKDVTGTFDPQLLCG
jgi:hypothetical protein